MSKPREVGKKEMLNWLRDLSLKYYSIELTHPHLVKPPTEKDKIIHDAIRRLIEKGPEVDNAFIERWTSQIFFLPLNAMAVWYECIPKQLRDMLREAGVRVKEAADEQA